MSRSPGILGPMPSYTTQKQLPHPVEAVFDTASDFPNSAEIVSAITKVEMLTDGPVAVGTRFKETRIMFKKEATETMEVAAFERPHRYDLAADSCGSKYLTELRFEPNESGTLITFTINVAPYTFMGKVMGFIFRPMMKSCLKMVSKDLEDVSAAIAARAEAC
jgi:hypothetical protein